MSYCEDGGAVASTGESRCYKLVVCAGRPRPHARSLCLQDKAGIPWWLGLSFKGISQYDYNDKRTPRRVSEPVSLPFLGSRGGSSFRKQLV